MTGGRTESAAETEAMAARLARELRPGDVVLVSGELGAGKTTFVRGACHELGVRSGVSSPTFTIGRRYEGQVPISHLDLYRLADLGDEDPALLDDYLRPDSISFVEWPEIARAAPLPERVRISHHVTLRHAGDDAREIEIEAGSGRPE